MFEHALMAHQLILVLMIAASVNASISLVLLTRNAKLFAPTFYLLLQELDDGFAIEWHLREFLLNMIDGAAELGNVLRVASFV